jgi:hypothetical protein
MIQSSKELNIIEFINYVWYNFLTSEFTYGINAGADVKISPAHSLRLVVRLSAAPNSSKHPVTETHHATKSESRRTAAAAAVRAPGASFSYHPQRKDDGECGWAKHITTVHIY